MINKETLKLFNCIQINNKSDNQKISSDIMKRTIKSGYILNTNIIPSESLLNEIEEIVGLSGIKANSTFHKSWKIIVDTDDEILVLQQIMHYITTYGFEKLGIYNESLVYIANEVLELPLIKDNLPLTIIKGLTKEEILAEIIKLDGSGIALHNDTLNDVMKIIETNNYDPGFISDIKNREL